MTRLLASLSGAIALAAIGGGCASISTGTSQAINVDSSPTEADCTLTREGQHLGTIKTPGPVTVKRDSRTIHIVCTKEGYEEGKVVLNSRFESATMGNLLVGGAIGLMVDSASGASNKYDAQVTVPLVPRGGAQATTPLPVAVPANSTVPPVTTPVAPTAATDVPVVPPSVTPVSGQSRSRL